MNIVLNNNSIDKYYGFLNKLDNNSKKRLIIKLTESIEVKLNTKFDLKSLCGSWIDSRTTEEIITDIKESRIEKNNSINL